MTLGCVCAGIRRTAGIGASQDCGGGIDVGTRGGKCWVG
jgi:hypothetical protein